jgi:chorismate mutase
MNAPPTRVSALRGAITAQANDEQSIVEATSELMRTIMERNALTADDMISCIFTATDDLDAEFPAVAARRLGLEQVPLLCTREIPVPGSLARVIRVLIHYHAGEGDTPRHVYLGEARVLREDLQAAQ